MAEDISIERELAVCVARDPFEPFVIIMTSGDRFRIDDRDQILVGRRAISIHGLRSGTVVLRKSQLLGLEMP